MAIAFFVPPEYGPAPVQQDQVQPQNPPVRVVNHAQDANNNNVRNNNVIQPPTRGLISIFVDEIMAVLAHNRNQESRNNNNHQHTLRDRRAARPQSNLINQQDNQNGSEGVLSYLPSLLPDIVTCHAGLSLRCGSGRPIPSQPEGVNGARVVPLSPRSNIAPACDFEVSLKLDLTMANTTNEQPRIPVHDAQVQSLPHELDYRIVGAQLRHIADNYTLQRSRNANQSSFEISVVISVALPAVALLGLGLAYLRR